MKGIVSRISFITPNPITPFKFFSIENSQIRVCSAGGSDTFSIGFLFIAYTGGKFGTGVKDAGGKPAEKFAADFNVTDSPTVDGDNNFRLLHLKLNTYNNKSIYKCKLVAKSGLRK
jgi:hypothetical protein